MKGFGKFLVCLWILFLLAMAGICVYGAFLGPQRAGELFNSSSFVFVWLAVAAVMVCICLRLILTRKDNWLAKFVVHFGILMVLTGGIMNSHRAWVMQDKTGKDFLDRKMVIKFGADSCNVQHIPGATLELRNTAIEYYPVKPFDAWKFYYQTVSGKNLHRIQLDIPAGAAVVDNIKIPGSDIEITTLTRFCEGMRDKPAIIIPVPKGVIAVDANIGDEIMIAGRLAKITRFYENLAVRESDGKAELVELAGGGLNPAVELLSDGERVFLLNPGMTIKNRYQMPDGNMYMYLPTLHERSGKAPPLVSMMDFKRGKHQMLGITAARENQDEVLLSLADLYSTEEKWKLAGAPTLVIKLQQPVKMMAALLDVQFAGGQFGRYAVSPNMPASIAGYYVYLESINTLTGDVTMSAVKDKGWEAVLAGFCVLSIGLCWLLWGNVRQKEKTA